MRKVLVLMAFSPLFFACGSGDNNASGEKGDSATTEQPAATANNQAELDKGAELIAGSNCLTCHKINEKIIGPTYMEVAQKYEATDAIVDSLAHKVITGGSGVWGNVPMTPHPELSMDTARMMVRYILSLRK